MAEIINIADFETGIFKIPTSTYQENDLQSYIDRYEKRYLTELLGVNLYDLFVADLVAGVPVTAEYVKIFNPISEEVNGCDIFSEGMKFTICGLIYFHYVRDNITRLTTGGAKRTTSDNSENIQALSANIGMRWNESVESYRAIQRYIHENLSDYPTFKGVRIQYTIPL